MYKLKLPNPIFGVPELKKIELKALKKQKLIILGLQKFVKNSPIESLWGV